MPAFFHVLRPLKRCGDNRSRPLQSIKYELRDIDSHTDSWAEPMPSEWHPGAIPRTDIFMPGLMRGVKILRLIRN